MGEGQNLTIVYEMEGTHIVVSMKAVPWYCMTWNCDASRCIVMVKKNVQKKAC